MKKFIFGNKSYSFNKNHCLVIGEIGVNHNNDRNILTDLIYAGKDIGVDVLKFQRFNSSLEISKYAELADYQKGNSYKSQLEMAKSLELDDELLAEGFELCKKLEIGFLCTPFEIESAQFLSENFGVKTVKLPSPDISNKILIDTLAELFDSIIISTGASFENEVIRAVNWINEKSSNKMNYALMHCTSQYPASLNQANLLAIKSLEKKFNVPVGYSDHTPGLEAGIISTALGAQLIEKHFTIDKNLPGPDHKASVNIEDFRQYIKFVREVTSLRLNNKNILKDILEYKIFNKETLESILGDGIKQPCAEEAETRDKIRKSVYLNINEKLKGSIIDLNDIAAKRPYREDGIQPWEVSKILSRKLKRGLVFDDPITMKDLE